MVAPVKQLKKADVEWLAEHYCKHRSPYLIHYSCFIAEKPNNAPFLERVGFLDIEGTGLKGNWDFILCYCLKDLDGEIRGRHLTPEEILTFKFDKDLTRELVADLLPFHRLVVYYGRDYRYDIPFIRTRAERWDIGFPAYRTHWVTDVYDIAKQKLCLHSTRLEHVCNLLHIPAKEHRLDPDIWQRAQAGHKKSLAWIFTHCQEDVVSLEAAWKRLSKYSALLSKRSI